MPQSLLEHRPWNPGV